jgi:hypothetical protein
LCITFLPTHKMVIYMHCECFKSSFIYLHLFNEERFCTIWYQWKLNARFSPWIFNGFLSFLVAVKLQTDLVSIRFSRTTQRVCVCVCVCVCVWSCVCVLVCACVCLCVLGRNITTNKEGRGKRLCPKSYAQLVSFG